MPGMLQNKLTWMTEVLYMAWIKLIPKKLKKKAYNWLLRNLTAPIDKQNCLKNILLWKSLATTEEKKLKQLFLTWFLKSLWWGTFTSLIKGKKIVNTRWKSCIWTHTPGKKSLYFLTPTWHVFASITIQ